MKKTGNCPKCNSSDILTDAEKIKQGHRAYLGISAFRTIRIATYVCMNCGYLEEYLDEKGFKTQSKINKFRERWKKRAI